MATATQEMASWLLAGVRRDLEKQDPGYISAFEEISRLSAEGHYERMKDKLEETRKIYNIQPKQPWAILLTVLQDYCTHMDMLRYNDEQIKHVQTDQGLTYYVRARFFLTKAVLETLDNFVKTANRKSIIPATVAIEQSKRIRPLLNDDNLNRGRHQVAHGASSFGRDSWAGSIERKGLWEQVAMIKGLEIMPMRLELERRDFYIQQHKEKYKIVKRVSDSVLREVRTAAEMAQNRNTV